MAKQSVQRVVSGGIAGCWKNTHRDTGAFPGRLPMGKDVGNQKFIHINHCVYKVMALLEIKSNDIY